MAATGVVRDMFGSLERGVQPDPADPQLIASLKAALAGQLSASATVAAAAPVRWRSPVVTVPVASGGVPAAAVPAGWRSQSGLGCAAWRGDRRGIARGGHAAASVNRRHTRADFG